jgi:hypothetical protein
VVLAAVVTGAASGVQGARLARQARAGAVPVESGTEPALETPQQASGIQRSLEVLGNAWRSADDERIHDVGPG